jgi:hypothetical protein
MRHFVPLQTERGAWCVAYRNHRGEFVSVMECGSFAAAYAESAAMTLDSTKRALCDTPAEPQHGNRYLRAFA